MKNFDFVNAKTLDEAVAVLAEKGENALLVAGGTNVMVDIRAGKINNKTLVSIRDIADLKGISEKDGVIHVGALTTISEIASSELLKEKAPALYMAANVFADPTTCHTATIGGNNVNASPDADTAAPLLALDATVHLKSISGEREVKSSDWYTGVRKTVRKADEIVTGFSFIPAKCAYYNVSLRKSMAISVLSAAVAIELDKDETVKWVRIALGSAGSKSLRAFNAEKAMTGKKLCAETYEAMNEALQTDISPRDGSIRATAAYKREVAPVCVKRAVKHALFGECQ